MTTDEQQAREAAWGKRAICDAPTRREIFERTWDARGEYERERLGDGGEQRLENDLVRRMDKTGRCPICGSDAR